MPSEKEKEALRREECRLACLAYLYDRTGLKMALTAVHSGVCREGYDFESDEVEVGLDFLISQGWAETQNSGAGVRKYYTITGKGQLHHEGL